MEYPFYKAPETIDYNPAAHKTNIFCQTGVQTAGSA
jgi:hypothetical protein